MLRPVGETLGIRVVELLKGCLSFRSLRIADLSEVKTASSSTPAMF